MTPYASWQLQNNPLFTVSLPPQTQNVVRFAFTVVTVFRDNGSFFFWQLPIWYNRKFQVQNANCAAAKKNIYKV